MRRWAQSSSTDRANDDAPQRRFPLVCALAGTALLSWLIYYWPQHCLLVLFALRVMPSFLSSRPCFAVYLCCDDVFRRGWCKPCLICSGFVQLEPVSWSLLPYAKLSVARSTGLLLGTVVLAVFDNYDFDFDSYRDVHVSGRMGNALDEAVSR